MLCELCKQTQATVHLTEIVNDQMAELHLCETCANQKGTQMEGNFGLSELLGGLADFGKPAEEPEEYSKETCGNCGMTYDDFRKIGRMGCSECYIAFKRGVGTLLKRIHGSTHHLGKSPMRLTRSAKGKSELMNLRHKLEQAIDVEAFEEAARLRDAIRRMEQSDKVEKSSKSTKSTTPPSIKPPKRAS